MPETGVAGGKAVPAPELESASGENVRHLYA